MAKKILGRGLSSLIPQKRQGIKARAGDGDLDEEISFVDGKRGVLEVEIEKIAPNPKQPRKDFFQQDINELADSIKEYGIIQPLVVSRKGENYELIVGERRLRAAKAAGFRKVPIIIRDVNEQKKLEMALVENLQREDLNPIERAMAYKQLVDEFGLKIEEVAKRVGKSRPVVSNTLRLLNLPTNIKEALTAGKISEGHAVNLSGIEPQAKQKNVFRKIVENKWTIDKTRKEIMKIGGTKESRIKINYEDKDREEALRNFFGTKVAISRSSKGGKVIIDFYSDEELENIVRKVK